MRQAPMTNKGNRPNHDTSSVSEMHDTSLISSGGGVPGLQSSQAARTDYFSNFDKKVNPKYPAPLALEKSMDFIDSNL